jgi:hypothetical protein
MVHVQAQAWSRCGQSARMRCGAPRVDSRAGPCVATVGSATSEEAECVRACFRVPSLCVCTCVRAHVCCVCVRVCAYVRACWLAAPLPGLHMVGNVFELAPVLGVSVPAFASFSDSVQRMYPMVRGLPRLVVVGRQLAPVAHCEGAQQFPCFACVRSPWQTTGVTVALVVPGVNRTAFEATSGGSIVLPGSEAPAPPAAWHLPVR